jgi:phosphate transport system permease protein
MTVGSRRVVEFVIERALFLCAAGSILVTAGIILVLLWETAAFLRDVPITDFLFGTVWTPLFYDKSFGVLPLVTGTLLVSAIAMAVALPAGLIIAIYLNEYAAGPVRRTVRPVLEVLAGIPTVVYGYFALLFVTPLLQTMMPGLAGFNALSPGIVMGIMILPLISSLSEDAMRAVPGGLREGAYALGSTRMQTSLRVVVPAAFSGISAAVILAMSRAIGETMIVSIDCGGTAASPDAGPARAGGNHDRLHRPGESRGYARGNHPIPDHLRGRDAAVHQYVRAQPHVQLAA